MKKFMGLAMCVLVWVGCSSGIVEEKRRVEKKGVLSLSVSYYANFDVWPGIMPASYYYVTNTLQGSFEDGTLFWKTNDGVWYPLSHSMFAFSTTTNRLTLVLALKKGDVTYQKQTNIVLPLFSSATSLVYEGRWNSGGQVRGILYHQGKIYAVLGNMVKVYSTNGDLLFDFGSGSFLHYIVYVDGRFYVTDYYGDKVLVYDTNHTFLFSWGSSGSGNGQFTRCAGIASDGTNIYVADEKNKRISVFTTNGVFLFHILTGGAEPRNVRVAGDKVYVSLLSSPHMRVYNLSGTLITSWDHPTMVSSDVSLITNGKVYILDWGSTSDHMYVYTTNGDLLYITNRDSYNFLQDPVNLCFDGYGRLYLSENGGIRVFRTE
ncbi:MAG: 6-bladed beta-propeller [Brevinematales bacterium]|nr:6-bladed beta-propeller [Brevinematales bacterium]